MSDLIARLPPWDIVSRLRNEQSPCQDMQYTAQNALQDEAAAEIEELRAMLKEARHQLRGAALFMDEDRCPGTAKIFRDLANQIDAKLGSAHG